MDPITGFVGIVSLLATYKQLKDKRKDDDLAGFEAFLAQHNFQELVTLISTRSDWQMEIASLLAEDHEQILKKLEYIENVVVTIAQNTGVLTGLATAFHGSELSDQANEILQWFWHYAKADYFRIDTRIGPHGPRLAYVPGGSWSPGETRFLTDDIQQLLNWGFLTLDCNDSGTELHRITRTGFEYLNQRNTDSLITES